MKEDFIEYIWRYRKYQTKSITTTQGDSLTILDVGIVNSNAGPDFFNTRIRINDQVWAGTVELHYKASDWYVHKHHLNNMYANVILHVVWISDVEVFDNNNNILPTLELQKIVAPNIIKNYTTLLSVKSEIPCSKQLPSITQEFIAIYVEKLLIKRLERKAIYIQSILKKNNNNWEATLYHLLCGAFGLKVNKQAFETLSQALPYDVVKKGIANLLELESLLFGQANLLSEQYDCYYYNDLKQTFQYQKHKYNLTSSLVKMNFHRMRPSNFPTIRLSQLANLYFNNKQLFNSLMHAKTISEYYDLLKVNATEYWDNHYTFGKQSKTFKKSISKVFVHHILINVVIPLKFVYSKAYDMDCYNTIQLYELLPAEKNSIVDQFKSRSFNVQNAKQSQAAIELKNEYCDHRACLKCEIGNLLLNVK